MNGWWTQEYPKHGTLDKGYLSYAEEFPFRVLRVFWIYDWPVGVLRGGHAHRSAHQLFIVTRGVVEFSLSDEELHSETLEVSGPRTGLYVPPVTWVVTKALAPGTSLMCLSSEPYDEGEYIRDPVEFQRIAEVSRREDDRRLREIVP